ncbi:hypothetical protein PRZ48_004624 [Zasmidium cellare]|uniref:DUF4440 domain-containing protein n=1 Tax=Zasmidium cellare TaxID=395010 RepID=A0ABR0EQ57_ZASCE|nr:hypothetical protein PRZ48_004624 [Zasmidium cellare]
MTAKMFFGPERPPAKQRRADREAKIRAELEWVHEMSVDMMNQNRFDLQDDLWQHYDEKVHVAFDLPHIAQQIKFFGRTELLETQKDYVSSLPGAQLGLNGVAMEYMDFHLIKGKWLVTAVSGVQGVDLLCCNGI